MPDLFGQDTVRLGILRKFKELYEASTDNPAPLPDKKYYGISFSIVELGPLSNSDARKRSAIGIVAGRETKEDLYPVRENKFDVSVEFRFTVNKGDADPAVMAESMLGVVQQIIYDNDTLDGTVIKVDEIANETNTVTYADNLVEGVVTFQVLYRHTFQNVYTSHPAV